MMPITLREYGQWSGPLDDGDLRYLARELEPYCDVRRDALTGQPILAARQFAGMVRLPSGRTVEIRPKVPLRHLFMMLSLAYDLPIPWLDDDVELAGMGDLAEVVVAFFLDRLQARIDRGLAHRYVETAANLPAVRGRIDFTNDLRQNLWSRQHIACRFAALTLDIPENQILRQTVHLLVGWGFRPTLQIRLHQLDLAMGEIAPTCLPATTIDGFTYDPHREGYAELHRFCRLFLDGMAPTNAVGDLPFPAFLFDMNRLFQDFVARVLASYVPPGIKLRPQFPWSLDIAGQVAIQPDLVWLRGDRPLFVADCKYKRYDTLPSTADLYQLCAYCAALGVRRGALIVPAIGTPALQPLVIRENNTEIHILALDLTPAEGDLLEAGRQLASGVEGLM
jgi:5-methylcytosine-specific restriction enzyme subunit McrC